MRYIEYTQSLLKIILKNEMAPGIFLLSTTIIALLLSNSGLAQQYLAIIHLQKPVNIMFIINDMLMTIFFLEVGLEIKHEMIRGHLSKPKQIFLPGIAALGGVLLPALIFVALNYSNPVALKGWAIPAATDIAFAIGIISLLGKRIPVELKTLLMAIAVIDDLIAILIIAIFYTQHINFIYLSLCFIVITTMYGMQRVKIHKLTGYLILGACLWFCMLKSGIHPTISGVVTGLAIPLSKRQKISPSLQIYISYLILPLFALVNAGVSLDIGNLNSILQPVSLGIACGLIVGKQLGIFIFAWFSIKIKIASISSNISWKMLYGMGLLCGVGFTMSIFIAHLAYDGANASYLAESKLGIILGSTISGILGALFLRYHTSLPKSQQPLQKN